MAALIIRSTSPIEFGIINMIATSVALLPFADLGLGAAVTTAAANLATGSQRSVEEFVATVVAALKVLAVVVIAIGLLAVCGAVFDLWGELFGLSLSRRDEWIVAGVFITFSLSVPLGLGARVLIGIGKTHFVAAMAPAISVVVLAWTVVLVHLGLPPLTLSMPPILAVVIVNGFGAAMAYLALRRIGVRGWSSATKVEGKLLAGSFAMLVIMVTLPAGLQSGRITISHLGSESDLARYSLAFQLYGAGYAAVAAGGAALWPIFVKRRNGVRATLKLWRNSLLLGALVGLIGLAVLTITAPPISVLISGGSIRVSHELGLLFGALFLAQAVHLPSGMMLTVPSELKWQAWCSTVTGGAAIVAAVLLVPVLGASGAVLAAASAVIMFQVIPDLFWGATLVRRRRGSASSAVNSEMGQPSG